MNLIIKEHREVRSGRRLRIQYSNIHSLKTIFCLHGLGGRSEHWQGIIESLGTDYNIVIPDLLGHGGSDKPRNYLPSTYSFTNMALDVQSLLDIFGTEANIVIGHSYGAALAANLAVSNKTINKLILVTPVVLHPYYPIPFLVKLPAKWLEIVRPLLEKQFGKIAFDPATPDHIVQREIDIARNNPIYVMKALIEGFKYIPNINPRSIIQPTLVITGYNDKLTPDNYVMQFCQYLPHVTFIKIPAASHMVIVEQKCRLLEIVEQFLGVDKPSY